MVNLRCDMHRVRFSQSLSVVLAIAISSLSLSFAAEPSIGKGFKSTVQAAQASSRQRPVVQITDKGVPQEEKQEAQPDIGEWFVQERIVFITGEIDFQLAEGVISQLLYLDAKAPGKDIYLYINSVGGEITAGMAIYDVMRSLRSNVVTVSIGESSSMGSFLLAAGTKGKRFALPSARIMIHQPWSGSGGGQASDIAIAAKEIVYLKNLLNRLLAEFTGQSLQRITIDTDRDFFMSAAEAKAYGIVDQVISYPPSSSRPTKTVKE